MEDVIVVSDTEQEFLGMDIEANQNIFVPMDTETIAEAKKQQGNDKYKAQNYQAALKLYSDALSLCPYSAALYGNRAACHMMLFNYQNALNDARTAIRIDPKFEKGYVRIAKCCNILGDINGAKQAIKQLEEINPWNSAIKIEQQSVQQLCQFEYDFRYCEDKSTDNLIYLLDNALKIGSGCFRYKLMKAEILVFQGCFDEAAEMAVDLMKMDTTSADAVYVLGLCFYNCDNLEKGLLYFERTIHLDPDHKWGKYSVLKCKQLKEKKESGNMLYESGRFHEALNVYTEGLAIDPHNKATTSNLYYNRASVYSEIGCLREAIVDCTKVLEISTNYLKALLLRARCNSVLGKFGDCVVDYEAALKIQETDDIKNMLHDALLALEKSKGKAYYKILGVNKNSTEEEMKKIYHKKSLLHHPDRHVHATPEERKIEELKFIEIGEAYAILSDSRMKTLYDYWLNIKEPEQEEVDQNAMYQQFYQRYDGDQNINEPEQEFESDSMFQQFYQQYDDDQNINEPEQDFEANPMFQQFYQFNGDNRASSGFEY